MERDKGEAGREEFETYIAERDKGRIYQERFVRQPKFLVDDLFSLTEDKFFIFSERVGLSEDKELQGTNTNISKMEVIYPFILQKIGLIPELKAFEEKNEASEPAIIGQKLHLADNLFTIITQDVRSEPLIKQLFPTMKKDLIGIYANAVDGVRTGRIISEEDLLERYNKAWSIFHLDGRSMPALPPKQSPLLPGFDLEGIKKEKEREYFFSKKTGDLGALLGESLTREYFKDVPMTWEFEKKVLTQREIMISLKFPAPNLQFNARIDSLTRKTKDKAKKKVKSQTVDLKTGKIREEKEGWTLADEVEKRQMQLTQLIGEAFTAKFALKYRNLVPNQGEIFTGYFDHGNKKIAERNDKVGLRYFNKETGEMIFVELTMTEEAREEFNRWFVWYGTMVNNYKKEIKETIDKNIKYDLNISLSYDATEIF